jgi:hypothetical protein
VAFCPRPAGHKRLFPTRQEDFVDLDADGQVIGLEQVGIQPGQTQGELSPYYHYPDLVPSKTRLLLSTTFATSSPCADAFPALKFAARCQFRPRELHHGEAAKTPT